MVGYKKIQWRLNEELLKQQIVKEYIQKGTVNYFKDISGKEPSIQMVWDAYKAVIRGNLIMLNNRQEKVKEKKFQKIQESIAKKE